jgi:hypothetical protein
LHTLSLCDENRSFLLSLSLGNILFGVGLELLLLLVDLSSSDLLLELIKLSLVDSLEVSELLLLLIVESQLLVFLLLFVILKLDLKSGFLLKGSNQLRIDNNIGDVTLFKLDAIWTELCVKVVHHCVSHIRLQIKDLGQPDTVDESSHILLNLCCEKFIKSSSTQFINKSFDSLLINGKSECEMNVNINKSIILGWASLNWSIIVDNVLGDHASDSLVTAVEPMGSCLHYTCGLTTLFLKDCEVGWDIKFDVTATATIRSLDHSNNSLLVTVSLSLHLVSCLCKRTGRYLDDS